MAGDRPSPLSVEAVQLCLYTIPCVGRPSPHVGEARIQSRDQMPAPQEQPLLPTGSLPLSLADGAPKNLPCCHQSFLCRILKDV